MDIQTNMAAARDMQASKFFLIHFPFSHLHLICCPTSLICIVMIGLHACKTAFKICFNSLKCIHEIPRDVVETCHSFNLLVAQVKVTA